MHPTIYVLVLLATMVIAVALGIYLGSHITSKLLKILLGIIWFVATITLAALPESGVMFLPLHQFFGLIGGLMFTCGLFIGVKTS